MNDFEREIETFKRGCVSFEYKFKDSGDIIKYPERDLDNLILFPKLPYSDTYNLEKFRKRPQSFHPDSLKLLQERSNLVVDNFMTHKPEKYELELIALAEKNGRDPEFTLFTLGVKFYCESILPRWKPDPNKDRKFAAVMRGTTPRKSSEVTYKWSPRDPVFREMYKHLDWKYWDRNKREVDAIANRFPLYKSACELLSFNFMLLDDPENMVIDWYDLDNSSNGSYIDWKEKQPQATRDLINPVLTQCVICYRFHLQDSRTRRSRFCPECKCQHEKKWKKTLEGRDDLKQRDVPLLAF
jgi:hypothetical protein